MDDVLNQGGCGSCWAFAAAVVLRGHSELYQQDRTFSTEEILSCTPNDDHCGGDGGCRGATSELAMAYVVRNGSVDALGWPYAGVEESGRCRATAPGEEEERQPRPASYTKLAENDLASVIVALYERGPVAVSVA